MVAFLLLYLVILGSLPFIHLPFTNPEGVVGQMALLRQNPSLNTVGYLLLLIPALLPFVPLQPLKDPQSLLCKWIHPLLMTFTVVILVAIMGLFYPLHLGYDHPGLLAPLHTFLEGESLGAATNYLWNSVPYREILPPHGPIEDIFLPVWAFSLFGKSIISLRLLTTLLTSLNLVLVLVNLHLLFERRWHYSLTAFFLFITLIFLSPFGFQILLMRREFTLLVTLLIFLLLSRSLKSKRYLNIYLFLFSFCSLSSLSWSGDRGLYLTLTSVGILIPISIFYLRSWRNYISILMGYLVGLFFLGLFINWAYKDYVTYFFLQLPRQKGLRSGLLTDFASSYGVATLIISGLLYIMIDRWKRREISTKEFFTTFSREIYLLLLAIVFMYSIVSRMDVSRLNRNLIPLFFVTALFAIRSIPPHLARLSSLILALHISLHFFPTPHLFAIPNSLGDEQLLSKDQKLVVSYLKDHLKINDSFLSMTNDGIWYYLLDRPSPIRFQSIYHAASLDDQHEVVAKLQTTSVRYLIMGKGSGPWDYDNISISKRVPIIWDYLLKNYSATPFQSETFEIWKIHPDTH